MITVNKNDIVKINKSLNESDFWVRDSLLDSCFSSYHYYENELEQVCSIFRGLIKNHPFSNANKRTASMFLTSYLIENEHYISGDDLFNIVMRVAENNMDVPEIASEISNMIKPLDKSF
jgi:death-on-curing family protein